MQSISKTILAGGAFMETTRGLCLSVKSSTLPINAAINGGPSVTVQAGTVLDRREGGWSYINFVNPNTVAVTIVYFVGPVPVLYQPGDNQQKIGKTATTAQLFNALSTSVVQNITNANAGRQRKQIVFTVDSIIGTPGANDGVIIQNLDGSVFCYVTKSTPLTFETDAAFKVLRSGSSPANLTLYVGEIYYTEGAA